MFRLRIQERLPKAKQEIEGRTVQAEGITIQRQRSVSQHIMLFFWRQVVWIGAGVKRPLKCAADRAQGRKTSDHEGPFIFQILFNDLCREKTIYTGDTCQEDDHLSLVWGHIGKGQAFPGDSEHPLQFCFHRILIANILTEKVRTYYRCQRKSKPNQRKQNKQKKEKVYPSSSQQC